MKPSRRSAVAFLGVAVLICLFIGPRSRLYGNETKGGSVKVVTDSTFEAEVERSKQPVLVDFWATWCGPCRMYGPIVNQLAEDYKGKLKVVCVDVDENPGLSRHFQIQAIPTSIFFNNGRVFKTLYGLQTEAHMKTLVGQLLKSKKELEHS